MPDMYQLVVNENHPLATKIVETHDTDAQKAMIKQAVDIAKLSMNLLKGEELTEFVKRSFEKL